MKVKPAKIKNVSRKLIKIIPDKIFYNLWVDSFKMGEQEYYKKYLRKDYCSKYNISSKHFYDLLNQIYCLSNMSLKKIIEMTERTKIEIRNRFCIPNRTFNAWYYEQNECPAYIKLIILREYHLIKLVHHIYTESDCPKSLGVTSSTTIPENNIVITDNDEHEPSEFKESSSLTEDFSFKLWEQEHVKKHNDDVQRLLKSLEYLDRR